MLELRAVFENGESGPDDGTENRASSLLGAYLPEPPCWVPGGVATAAAAAAAAAAAVPSAPAVFLLPYQDAHQDEVSC